MKTLLAVAIIAAASSIPATLPAQNAALAPAVGRWDITVTGPRGTYPSWLEVRLSGNRMLVGQFVGNGGSARPISKIDFASNRIRFALPPQWDRADHDLTFDGQLAGGNLAGSMIDANGNHLTWVGVRAPSLRRSSEPRWGKSVHLFNGKDIAGWHALGPNQWQVIKGVLTSAKAGSNLATDQQFTDFKLHVEFRYPKDGNSGVYLRGRYEVQIEDSGEEESPMERLSAVYGFLPPNQNAAKAPGEWQVYDITLVGRTVTVVLNGKTVICSAEIPGITGGALNSDEGSPGPIYLQGDHAAIEYRNIVITPAK